MNRNYHHPSKRALHTPASPIRRLAGFAAAAEARGTNVIRLNIGQPDIASPPTYLEAVRSFSSNLVAYETSQGNVRLREVWTEILNKQYKLSLKPEEMLITMGASEALIFLFMVCCDPGDEVLVFDPTYANYQGFAAIAGVHLVPVSCPSDQNFHLPDRSDIEAQISRRTRALLICSPNNPTGTTYSRVELEILQSICHDRGIFLVVDETYREFVYDGLIPYTALELGDDPSIIIVDSLSKRFSLCGTRIGCLVTRNAEVMQCAFHIAQARLAAPTIEQLAASIMLEQPLTGYLETVIGEYKNRRDTLLTGLAAIPNIRTFKPEGAFYALLELPVKDAEDFATYLLTDFSHNGKTLFLAPGAGFYMQRGAGKTSVRLGFVLEEERLLDAAAILGQGIEAYQAKKRTRG